MKNLCQGSRFRYARRCPKLPTVKWSDRSPSQSSLHSRGVETDACGKARVEYAATRWKQTRHDIDPHMFVVAHRTASRKHHAGDREDHERGFGPRQPGVESVTQDDLCDAEQRRSRG